MGEIRSQSGFNPTKAIPNPMDKYEEQTHTQEPSDAYTSLPLTTHLAATGKKRGKGADARAEGQKKVPCQKKTLNGEFVTLGQQPENGGN